MITVANAQEKRVEARGSENEPKRRALRVIVPTPLYGGSLPIARHAADALRANGHDVALLDFEDQYSLFKRCESLQTGLDHSIPLQATVAALLADVVAATAIKAQADLVWFTAQSPISRRSLNVLRQADIKTVMWFVEDFRRYEYWKALVPELDCVFTIQTGEVFDAMSKCGARIVRYLPAAANLRVHQVGELTDDEKMRFGAPVSFVGAGYRNRVEFFQRNKIEGLRVWGNDWPEDSGVRREEAGRRLSTEETSLVYRASAMNLNLHSTSDGSLLSNGDFVNPRTFEIAASRGFQICNLQRPLRDLMELGSEIVAVSTEREMLDAIEFYRNRPEERAEIAQRGYRRVLRDHTYEKRMQEAVDILVSLFPERHGNVPHRSRFMEELILASQPNPELVDYLEMRADQNCHTLQELIGGIPVGQRNLTRAEMLLLALHEFRQWGIEKKVIA